MTEVNDRYAFVTSSYSHFEVGNINIEKLKMFVHDVMPNIGKFHYIYLMNYWLK